MVGLLLTVWVVGMRGLLNDRAVLDRWVSEVTSALQSAVEERVATRVLAAEAALTADMARRDEAESATAAIGSRRSMPSCANTPSRPHGPPRSGTGGCRRCRRRWTLCARSCTAGRTGGRTARTPS